MPYRIFLFIALFTVNSLHAQVLRWTPTFIQEGSSTITITGNANYGNKGLQNYSPGSDVYVHIGAITNLSTSSSDWKYAPFTWGTTTGAANAGATAVNEWTFTITGGLRNFFKITNANEKILKIAILFRSGNGSKALRNEDGSDMYIPVYDNGLYARIDMPYSHATYTPSPIAINTTVGSTVPVSANASISSDLKLYFNGSLINSNANATNLTGNPTITSAGAQKIVFESTSGANTAKDSISFYVTGPAIVEAQPAGTSDGINYEPGDTSATLVLFAPGKSNIAVLGDFNSWTETANGQMKKTPDGKRFWIRLTGLKPNTEYAYQFLIDGSLRVADYNAEKILDPNNDIYISPNTYPALKAYPTNKTTGIVSVLQTAKPAYNWKVTNFTRPEKSNLIIYELLIRDFLSARNFQALKDTIPYLKRLGINAIELMPFSEFEGNLSWGYNPNFFFAPDKYYGTETAIRDFIDACHQQGIAVIMDMVLNHCFNSSPHAQMYWDASNNQPATNNPWLNTTATHPYSVGNDFNHESQATKDLVARVVRHWMTKYKIDGMRWDLSKGFTQTNNPTNVGAWGNYDASRVSTWKRIYDTMQAVSPNSYCILEHFADNTEEKELADYGMLLWGNGNYNFAQANMGYTTDADFSGISSEKRSWTKRHLVGYMESHDEERLMYKNTAYGNQTASYSTRDSNTALLRSGMSAAFWAMMPGPKMMWEFGELGFHSSINTCADGSVNNNCRLDNKTPAWDFYSNPLKRHLFDVYSNLLRIRTKSNYLSTFASGKYTIDFSGTMKSMQIDGDSLKIVVVGNFDMSAKSATVAFPANGTWYSYLNGTNLNVSGGNANITLQAGEFHVYLNKDLSNNIVTALTNNQTRNSDFSIKTFPNPAKNAFQVHYNLPESSTVEITVSFQHGLGTRKLLHEFQMQGAHKLNLNREQLGIKQSTGLIFLTLRTKSGVETKTILLH